MELKVIQAAAKQTTDENGNPVIQIPRQLWDAFLAEQETGQVSQITALLSSWGDEPQDDMPASWWDEFMEFLADNRFKLGDSENE